MSIEPIKYWLVASRYYKKVRDINILHVSDCLHLLLSRLRESREQDLPASNGQRKKNSPVSNTYGFSISLCT